MPDRRRPRLAPAALALGLATQLTGPAPAAPTGLGRPQEPAAEAAGGRRPARDTPEALWERGERRAAIAALVAELSSAPTGAQERRRRLALWQLSTHGYEAALATSEEAGGTLDDLRGEALYALTRYDEALRYLMPDRPEHALLRIDALEALGRLEDAGEALATARVLLGPDDPRLATFEGRARARSGDHVGAIERFRAALVADPLDQGALFGLGRSLLATGARDQGVAALEEHRRRVPLIDALEFAQQGLDLEPRHAPNQAAVGDAERALGRFELALTYYRRALELTSGRDLTPIALRAARLLEQDLQRAPEALSVLAEAFGRTPDVRLAVRAGDVAARAGAPEDARAWYGRALELRPSDPSILQRLDAVDAGRER